MGTFHMECKDIVLREYAVGDLDALYVLTQEPEIMAFLPDWNVPKDTRREWMTRFEIPENRRFLQAVQEGGRIGELRLRLGIHSKTTGEFIGWCCTGMKEELSPPIREMVYAVSPLHRKKGYAAQAVQGLIRFLFDHTDTAELCALALPHNKASLRVIEKCGFVFWDTVEIGRETYNYYKLGKTGGTPGAGTIGGREIEP
ncbi:GNAT family N-acetyltransferase [Paenibacillus mucilaginosus]|uniref:GCN5-related N-acetyltransferase n=1 Tax=Paenibacillus mucilaginosus (strain KNP414) TaxID=1036673 RepID=F8F9I7_PAEMK|nr:GNAT family N-acetyltransferase [Paenibacillus mucilaginosus]AEI43676.1 GCN5-related N-acetyltransferase [Paenibacillus mucilaginosus KNP414]MCG7216915.1 GNAT family N-acetyltransferase [Paenibacillus mucilaginosus]WDM25202.1 GNAT family N-acetyltransferase [Paenibacillus mucilaginosus]